jgi:diguanylate cyclase (GGDEF)-like protein
MRPVRMLLLLTFAACSAAAMTQQEAESLLLEADRIKMSDPAQFANTLQTVAGHAGELSALGREHLQYLQAWRSAYSGNFMAAIPTLNTLVTRTQDATLQFRSRATLVNVYAVVTRYQDAFTQLNELLNQLPHIDDPAARQQGMEVASFLYSVVGEYKLALDYAERVVRENPGQRGACRGAQLRLQALHKSQRIPTDSPQYRDGINTCLAEGELLFASAIRTYVARSAVSEGDVDQAINILLEHYADVQATRYPRGISEWDSMLAQNYASQGNAQLAKRYALRTIEAGVKDHHTEPMVTAYRVLYEIAAKQGDAATALSYLEKYVSADKGYLDDVSARQLAYERAKHENASNKLQIAALNQENKLLQLQRELDSKAAETSRLYIALLIVVVVFIALWAYRTKRSQLHFMKLSQVDGLTGIANRPRFIQLAETVLEAARRSQQQVSVVLCDLDHFKAINDRFGHAAGDHVLRQTVMACQAHLRVSDIFGRFGGEEFGIVLPGCGLVDAEQRAERLRVAVAGIVPQYEGERCSVSASFGVASTATSGYELRQLLAHADAALYRAKAAGRDRVMPYEPGSDAVLPADIDLRNANRA